MKRFSLRKNSFADIDNYNFTWLLKTMRRVLDIRTLDNLYEPCCDFSIDQIIGTKIFTDFNTSVGIWDIDSWNSWNRQIEDQKFFYNWKLENPESDKTFIRKFDVDTSTYPNKDTQAKLINEMKDYYDPNEFTWSMFLETKKKDFNPIDHNLLKIFFHKFRCDWIYKMHKDYTTFSETVQHADAILGGKIDENMIFKTSESYKDYVLEKMDKLFDKKYTTVQTLRDFEFDYSLFETSFITPVEP